MKKILGVLLMCFLLTTIGKSQTIEELKSMKADKEAALEASKAEADALTAEISSLLDQINLLSGWRTGFAGIVGLSLSESNKWAANPNPTASSTGLSIAANAFLNRNERKWFWNNKLLVNKAWQTIVIEGADGTKQDGGDLFDNGTIDILNFSSLYGYKLTETIALSALGELNTSIENFLEPGTIDLGVGATWTPIPNLVVVVHPLNYRITFPVDGNVSSEGALGAKLRADYARDLMIAGKEISWSSTLTAFFPYSNTEIPVIDSDGVEQQAGLNEFTWLNTVSFNLWKGVGVGATLGLRKADFEVYEELQNFYTLGLSYTL